MQWERSSQQSPAMRDSHLLLFLLFLLIHSAALAAAQASANSTSKWLTLSGEQPLVIARGGFSGLFADSSFYAFKFALSSSLSNVLLWCDVQLTKDGAGICFPDVVLDNASDITYIFQNMSKEYIVNGQPIKGLFTVDFTLDDLANVSLTQAVYSRSSKFDDSQFPIMTVENVATMKPPGLWLNIQHDEFFRQNNLSMRSFVLSIFRSVVVKYISSPEVNFLRSIEARKPSITKLVFRFLGKDETEPFTNQTYGSLLQNLTFVRTFASGILVPKGYIWPVDESLYLQTRTSLVVDAHKAGLEVFASDFANDVPFSYNFSYDPVAEYLSFMDNGEFSVDGVLSDFPITPSEAIGCFSHIGKNDSGQANPLVIAYKGSSGEYPACTDMAYTKAILDGANFVSCPVQMTKDGIPVCLSHINLMIGTNVAQSNFINRIRTIQEINVESGVIAPDLTWREIQSLTPAISNPYVKYQLWRNPKFKSAGKFLMLSEFLAVAKNLSSLSGVLIVIENAAYLAEKHRLGMIDAVLDALRNSSYGNSTANKEVMIQSTDSSVLKEFKKRTNYELVYQIDEDISDIDNSALGNIKKFASAVVISKGSVFPTIEAFFTGVTNVVSKLHSFKLSCFLGNFNNEFVSQAWDCFSDSTVEINSYVMGAGIDGVITEFPKTAVLYKRNRCLRLGNEIPIYMRPSQPGGLFQLIPTQDLPPAAAPLPALTDFDVLESPLPSVSAKSPSSSPNRTEAAAPNSPNGQPNIASCLLLSGLAMLMVTALLY
ncbi:glycerophosphodiester phosphodiesterase GDPDL3-like isoform X2 [Malania oleifera]|uniref:glycerophosphodiester phosphodiesterase GDPDL3-like isoform X2 n=1 Tax=Malania oleifera TaxID=397392 RepID=UPI0025AE5763|nr:glycerophosphodiester phosphodiesterase GDPDL3-like isoform X2 [Malania oleifera]